MSTDRHPSVRHKTQEALRARDALAAALTRAGIQLPAMDVRTPWNDELDEHLNVANDERPTVTDDPTGTDKGNGTGPRRQPRYALVHLGVCSAPVAHELAQVIERGATVRGAGE